MIKKNNLKNITALNIIINIVLSVIKIISGTIFFSPALISDGIHSGSDLITDIAVYISSKLSEKPGDKEHPYGHGKINNIANLIIALILIATAINIMLKSLAFISHTNQIHPSLINLAIAGISVLLKEFLFHKNKKIGQELANETLLTNAWHHRSDALSSLAVFIGILLGYINKKLIIADPIIGIFISFLIIFIGFKILQSTFQKIIDKNISKKLIGQIKETVLSVNKVEDIHKIRGRYYGDKAIVDFHALLNPNISLIEAHKITHEIKNTLIEKIPKIIDVIIHTEPNIKN